MCEVRGQSGSGLRMGRGLDELHRQAAAPGRFEDEPAPEEARMKNTDGGILMNIRNLSNEQLVREFGIGAAKEATK